MEEEARIYIYIRIVTFRKYIFDDLNLNSAVHQFTEAFYFFAFHKMRLLVIIQGDFPVFSTNSILKNANDGRALVLSLKNLLLAHTHTHKFIVSVHMNQKYHTSCKCALNAFI